MKTNTDKLIHQEVELTLKLESELQGLIKNPVVQQFLELQSRVNEKAALAWKNIEKQMIEADIKKVSGDWGSLTIAERLDFDIDDEQLAPRFKKTVADTTKIRTIYQLDRKPIAGAIPKYKRYLVKRLKIGEGGQE